MIKREPYKVIKKRKQEKILPIFETLITLFSYNMAAILFFYPELFNSTDGRLAEGYNNLQAIASAQTWSYIFFISATIKAVGILARIRSLRILGLLMSAAVYAIMAIAFAFIWPNFSTGIFALLSLTSLLHVFYTEHFEF